MNVPLIIGPETRACAQLVVDHAKQRQHWMRYNAEGEHLNKELCGQPEFTCVIPMGFYCVFTYAHYADGSLYRVLSIQIPGRGIPNLYKAAELALLFGFTGWDRNSELPREWNLSYPASGQWVSFMQELPCR